MINKYLQGLGAGGVLALLLAGCGGGGGGADSSSGVATPAQAQPPAIAQALAYIAQQQALPEDVIQSEQLQRTIASPDDTIEPHPI
ncbi:MAG TPA: hypothetical protein VK439_02415 [Rubrivivax sp.]|nr:hypothetical protein [Rubrivivax sp.]